MVLQRNPETNAMARGISAQAIAVRLCLPIPTPSPFSGRMDWIDERFLQDEKHETSSLPLQHQPAQLPAVYFQHIPFQTVGFAGPQAFQKVVFPARYLQTGDFGAGQQGHGKVFLIGSVLAIQVVAATVAAERAVAQVQVDEDLFGDLLGRVAHPYQGQVPAAVQVGDAAAGPLGITDDAGALRFTCIAIRLVVAAAHGVVLLGAETIVFGQGLAFFGRGAGREDQG